MPFVKNYNVPEPVTQPPCVYLRVKAVYCSPNYRDDVANAEPDSEYVWCALTQHVYGPDQRYVGRRECVPGRNCYRDTY